MEDKIGLTLACLNLKKLIKWRTGKPFYFGEFREIAYIVTSSRHICLMKLKKTNFKREFVFNLRTPSLGVLILRILKDE